MLIRNNKTTIRRAYTAARAYINAHADKYGDETTVRLNALRVVRNQLLELLDEHRTDTVETFSDYGAFEKQFLDGAPDMYSRVSGGGSIFPFCTTDVLRLFYTEKQARRWYQWAAGEGAENYALSDVMRTESKWIETALAHMWAALKDTRAE